MHCTIKSRKYNTTIEFWRHGYEIKVRTVDHVSELDDLDYCEGVTMCEGGRLCGGVIKFYDGWGKLEFQETCKDWWRKYVRSVD